MPAIEKHFLSVREACVYTGSSKAHIYRLLQAGTLTGKKLGRKTIISTESIKQYIDSLPDYESGAGGA